MTSTVSHSCRTRRGFTLIELLVSLLVIFLLMGILIVSIRTAVRSARSTADTQTVIAMRIAVEQFRTDFGFLPPVVDYDRPFCAQGNGTGDPINGDMDPVIIPADELRDPDRCRFSVYSLPYYLGGVLSADIDGVEGPGFKTPLRDGRFDRERGKEIEPLIDTGRSIQTYSDNPALGRVEFRDRNGVPFRYYRWLPDRQIDGLEDLNVPRLLNPAGNPTGGTKDDPRLRSATYAIVGAGPNKVFGEFDSEDEDAVRDELGMNGAGYTPVSVENEGRSDNIVEVGE